MSRGVVFNRPGLTPGQIITRGVNKGSEILGRGITDLERRREDMTRKTDNADHYNSQLVGWTAQGEEIKKGPIEDMVPSMEKYAELQLLEADKTEDPVLRASMRETVNAFAARAMSNTLRFQTSREVGRTVATGEDMVRNLDKAISDGVMTAAEAIPSFTNFTAAQTDNVYGDNVDGVNQSAATQMIDAQLDMLMQSDTNAAMKFTDSDTAKQWLTAKQRNVMKGRVQSAVNSSLLNIESRAVAITNSNFPDKVQQLEGLKAEVAGHMVVARTKLSNKELDARISNAKKQQTRTVDRVALGFAVQDGTSSEQHPNEQVTLNAMYELSKSDPAKLQTFLQGIIRAGVDFPDSYVEDLKKDGEQGRLGLARGVGQLRQIGRSSIDRAARLADDAGRVMETAYESTLRISDPLLRQERFDVLSSPDAPGLIAAAEEAIGDDILDDMNEAKGFSGFGLASTALLGAGGLALASTGFGLNLFRSAPFRMGPEGKTEMQGLYDFHWVKARRDLATEDTAILKSAALKNAARDWNATHSAVKITTGANHFRYIANDALSFDNSAPLEQAASAVTLGANRLLRTAGSDAGFLSENPIVDGATQRSWFAVTNSDGVHGLVEWDAGEGSSRIIRSGDTEFDSLRTQMSVRRLNPMPNADLVKQPGQTMTDKQQITFIDMGIAEFFSQNGRMPAAGDQQAVDTITAMLEQGKGWD